MEVQSECVEPPVAPQCDSQPAGKINKAAFKLFGKRRAGSGMASFFSFRSNKGGGNNGSSDNGNSLNGNGTSSAASAEIVRSRTHDGLTGSGGDGDGPRGEGPVSLEAGPMRSLSKSLSFFSLLRRGSFRSGENGSAGLVRRGRGLKGFFSSMRWRRRDKTNGGDEAEGRRGKVSEAAAAATANADLERVKDVTLTLEPPLHRHQGDEAEPHLDPTPSTSAAATPPSNPNEPSFPCTPTDSPLRLPAREAKASVCSLTPSLATPPLDRCSVGDPPSEPSAEQRLCSLLLFADVTSLKSFDSLTGCGDIIADADEEGPAGNGGGGGGSGTSSSSSGGGGGSNGVTPGRAVGFRCSPSKAPLPVVPQLTNPAPCSIPARARTPLTSPTPLPPQQQQQQTAGSGVVAYMGGGEEMASPEGVDDADMQGLWHMLPSKGDDSPALPRSRQPVACCSAPTSTYPPRAAPGFHAGHPSTAPRSAERKATQAAKPLGLSKIPVVGCGTGSRTGKPPLPQATHGRHPASPGDKEPLSDEGYWDTPSATPTATPDESGLAQHRRMALLRDSCSGDHLYDLYNDPEDDGEEAERAGGDASPRLSPTTAQTTPLSPSSSSSFRPVKGSSSLPRESKIPVSSRQMSPPHSASQTTLSSVLEAESSPPKTCAPPPARTRIPVSKVPVRRSGNKPSGTGRGTGHKK
ncbi:APC membrane recruitment protein 2 [Nelusetta ayraudi]|uniref:APC membrane recruitment protein 2 n=1 Tax=Nelusetta ayraudi TaxID=303726 RepID=UPI003F6EF575